MLPIANARVIAATIAAVVLMCLPVTGTAQVPPSLVGLDFEADYPNASGACTWEAAAATVSFSTSGVSTFPFEGTFVESGTFDIGDLNSSFQQPLLSITATFEVHSPYGTVTGTKWFEPGVSNGSGGCRLTNSGPVYALFAYDLYYEATIVTPDGRTCTDTGTSGAFFTQNSSALVDHFDEYFDITFGAVCTGDDSGEDPPADQPVTREDCFNDGWEAYGFRSLGECIAFVSRPR